MSDIGTIYSVTERIFMTLAAHADEAREVRGLSQDRIREIAGVSGIELSFVLREAQTRGAIEVTKDERRRNVYRLTPLFEMGDVLAAREFVQKAQIDRDGGLPVQNGRTHTSAAGSRGHETSAGSGIPNPVRDRERSHVCSFAEPGYLGIYVTRECSRCAASQTLRYERPNLDEWNLQDLMLHTVYAIADLDDRDAADQLALMNLKNAMLHVIGVSESRQI